MKNSGTGVGAGEGVVDGLGVGAYDGAGLGDVVGYVVGLPDGLGVGLCVGRGVGPVEGTDVGLGVGTGYGECVGLCVGWCVGLESGAFVGPKVGAVDGLSVGRGTGYAVGPVVGTGVTGNVGLVVGRVVGPGDGESVVSDGQSSLQPSQPKYSRQIGHCCPTYSSERSRRHISSQGQMQSTSSRHASHARSEPSIPFRCSIFLRASTPCSFVMASAPHAHSATTSAVVRAPIAVVVG